MKTASLDCESALREFRPFAEGELEEAGRRALEDHLLACQACAKEFAARRKLYEFIGKSYGAHRISGAFATAADRKLRVPTPPPALEPVADERDEAECAPREAAPLGFFERLGATPWWGVSVCLHALIILLLGLITMTIGAPEQENGVIVVTSLEHKMSYMRQEQKLQTDLKDIFNSAVEVKATDPDSKQTSNIVVPPEILAQAELGDHFETINLDKPDLNSAFGNPDARMFHSTHGSDAPEGGGGMGGATLLESLIGIGGSACAGEGGGWGGGVGTGIGVGLGNGTGSFGTGSGDRLVVMRHGGGKPTMVGRVGDADFLGRRMALIFDNSYSMQNVVAFAKDVVLEFLKNAKGRGTIDFYSEMNKVPAHNWKELLNCPLRTSVDQVTHWFAKELPQGGNDTIGEAASSVWWAFDEVMKSPPDLIVFVTDWRLHSPNHEYTWQKQTALIKERLEQERSKPVLMFFTQTDAGPQRKAMEELAEMTKGIVSTVKGKK